MRTGAHRFFFIEGGTRPRTGLLDLVAEGVEGLVDAFPAVPRPVLCLSSSHAISSPPISAPGRFRLFRFLRGSFCRALVRLHARVGVGTVIRASQIVR